MQQEFSIESGDFFRAKWVLSMTVSAPDVDHSFDQNGNSGDGEGSWTESPTQKPDSGSEEKSHDGVSPDEPSNGFLRRSNGVSTSRVAENLRSLLSFQTWVSFP